MNILNYDDAFTPVDKGPYKEGSWGFIVIIAAWAGQEWSNVCAVDLLWTAEDSVTSIVLAHLLFEMIA